MKQKTININKSDLINIAITFTLMLGKLSNWKLQKSNNCACVL
jgi:hypothetical protein